MALKIKNFLQKYRNTPNSITGITLNDCIFTFRPRITEQHWMRKPKKKNQQQKPQQQYIQKINSKTKQKIYGKVKENQWNQAKRRSVMWSWRKQTSEMGEGGSCERREWENIQNQIEWWWNSLMSWRLIKKIPRKRWSHRDSTTNGTIKQKPIHIKWSIPIQFVTVIAITKTTTLTTNATK